MLEAIGEDQWRDYFATIDRLLAPGGSACIQTILIPDQRFARYRATPDWIERYVFPGCLIPSLAALVPAIAAASTLSLYGIDEIGPHYADTLREWRRRFHASREQLPDYVSYRVTGRFYSSEDAGRANGLPVEAGAVLEEDVAHAALRANARSR